MSESIMIPQVGDEELQIPLTLDYSGGRTSSNRTRYMWATVASIGVLFIAGGILISNNNFFVKLIIIALWVFCTTWLIRRFLLKENKYRKELRSRLENDYDIKMSNFWGIYRISSNDYCYLRNGWVGLYVMLEKGAIVGKDDEDEFNHYQSIADAYNIMGSSRLRVCHIDLMDFLGRDGRIRAAYRKFADYPNEDMRDLMSSIFHNLQSLAEDSVTSYDIYFFMYQGDEIEFEKELEAVIACFLSGNYTSYSILGKSQIQSIAASLFNLDSFSVNEAMREAFRRDGRSSAIIPISVAEGDDVTVFNKTKAELAREKEENAQRQAYINAERDRRKKEAKAKGRKSVVETTTVDELDDMLLDMNIHTTPLDELDDEELKTGEFNTLEGSSAVTGVPPAELFNLDSEDNDDFQMVGSTVADVPKVDIFAFGGDSDDGW